MGVSYNLDKTNTWLPQNDTNLLKLAEDEKAQYEKRKEAVLKGKKKHGNTMLPRILLAISMGFPVVLIMWRFRKRRQQTTVQQETTK
jgi:hypothetical protein